MKERVQLKLLKCVLGFNNPASYSAVLAQCDTYPLHVNYFTKHIKFWQKIINMNDNRLVDQESYHVVHKN